MCPYPACPACRRRHRASAAVPVVAVGAQPARMDDPSKPAPNAASRSVRLGGTRLDRDLALGIGARAGGARGGGGFRRIPPGFL